jgi:carbamoyltransferase
VNILGISCFYHDSAACLLKDGELISAAQEERFNREKYSEVFPINSINFCLQAGNLTINDVDFIGFYEKPFLKFSRVILNHLKSFPFSYKNFLDTIPLWLEDRLILPLKIKRELGYGGKLLFIKHHLSHAASAFLVSPFKEAAILTADGVGEWATTTFGLGQENRIQILKELVYPDSLGLFYAVITTYLGFNVFEGEGKVMGLAAYGNPRYADKFKELITVNPDGSYRLNQRYFSLNRDSRMFSRNFVKLFGAARKPQDKIEERHCDIAATLQEVTERTLIAMAKNVHNQTKADKLCLAGGVFLNCVANQKILEETPFKEVFIQPAAGDNGGALGAAYYIYNTLLGSPRNYTMSHVFLGPDFSTAYIRRVLLNRKLDFQEFGDEQLADFIADKLSKDLIIGWFQGKMEFGPRALGNRSILAAPCNPRIKDILNSKVKKRESFRPYAPAVLEECAKDFFETECASPYMLLAPRIKKDKVHLIPAAVHVDGTARLQTVNRDTNRKFWLLIKAFEKITGIPMLINTSFNIKGEAMVCTPEEAVDCFQRTAIDYLVLENFIICKPNGSSGL